MKEPLGMLPGQGPLPSVEVYAYEGTHMQRRQGMICLARPDPALRYD